MPEPLFRCNQMYVERELHAHLKTLPAVELRYGWRCTGFADRGDRVDVELEQVATGRRESRTCAYLVGADGGQGVVRRGLGIRYGGEVLNPQVYGSGATISTHLRAPALYERIVRRFCWQYWIVNARVRSLLTALDGGNEFLFNTRCRSIDDPPDRDMIMRQLRGSIGEDVAVEFLAHTPWTAGQALVADEFGRGRVVLAGDAVHLFTPTGGFGMNTGIDDAANLGWKLAAMVQGWGGPRLLASYEAERRPIAFRNTGHAKRLTRSMADVPVASEIEDDSAAGDAARAAAGQVLSTFGEEFASIGVQLGARYDGSADRRRRRHRSAARRSRHLRPQRVPRRPRAACVDAGPELAVRPFRPRLHLAAPAGLPRGRRRAGGGGAAAQRGAHGIRRRGARGARSLRARHGAHTPRPSCRLARQPPARRLPTRCSRE